VANSRRPVPTVRKLVAAVLGTLAFFVILFGAGMTSWAIAALGFALLVLAISLVLVTAFPGAERAWVAGIAHVRHVSEPPASSTYGRCELQILVDAPGVPPRSVKVRDPRVPVAKWPDPGATLPIMVAIDDQRHVRIIWDDVLTHAEAAAHRADLPPEFDEPDFGSIDEDLLASDDDLLGVDDDPPWTRRAADDDLLTDDLTEARTADRNDGLDGLLQVEPDDLDDDDSSRRGSDPRGTAPREDPVVVRQTPGGPIVLEGTLVDPLPLPLPRRPRPRPYPSGTTAPGDVEGLAGDGGPRSDGGDGEPARQAEPSLATTGTALADPPAEPPLDLCDPAGGNDAIGMPGPDTGPDDIGPIHGVGLTLLVANLDQSVAFYRDTLGFFEIDAAEGNAILASGQTRLVLRAVPEVAPINRRLMHLNLEVDDIQTIYQGLKAKGMRFTYAPRVVNRGTRLELWAAAFRDPDGHGIAIIEWRERGA